MISNEHGHYSSRVKFGQYIMNKCWIDTDNEVWSEPYHLYGLEPKVNEDSLMLRMYRLKGIK
jgi:hypothetical protein